MPIIVIVIIIKPIISNYTYSYTKVDSLLLLLLLLLLMNGPGSIKHLGFLYGVNVAEARS
jgi:hypothetical protein